MFLAGVVKLWFFPFMLDYTVFSSLRLSFIDSFLCCLLNSYSGLGTGWTKNAKGASVLAEEDSQ